MNRKLTLLLLFVGCCIFSAKNYAQYENVWAFGNFAGLDFNSGKPEPIKTSIETREGCASIADERGKLLFYTDGDAVWNRTHKQMPNGKDLAGVGKNITASTTQGAIIIPMPGEPKKYYIFSLGAGESGFYGRLSYSVIDMELDNGLGDLIPATRGTLLDSNQSEHMTAVSGNNCDIWLLTLSNAKKQLSAHKIDANGVSAKPVLSPVTTDLPYNWGCMDVSMDRTKIAITSSKLILMDFDPEEGKATHAIQIHEPNNYYGVCFSPDGSKLYAANGSALYQFDLSSDDSVKIRASRTYLTDRCFSMKRGPDGKIYTTASNAEQSGYLNIINKPNAAGVDVQLEKEAVSLLPGTAHRLGFPNTAVIIKERHIYHSFTDTLLCNGAVRLQVNDTLAQHIFWNDGTREKEREVSQPGIYWVQYEKSSPCITDYVTDTFIVLPHINTKIYSTLALDGACAADTLSLQATYTDGIDYVWNDGVKEKQRKVNTTGVFWLSYERKDVCEDHVDTFKVHFPNPDPSVSFLSDTLICQTGSLEVKNTSAPVFTHYTWFWGDGTSSIEKNPAGHDYRQPGTYKLLLTGYNDDRICFDSTEITITVDAPVEHISFSKDYAVICAGAEVSLTPIADGPIAHLLWEFGDGTAKTAPNEKITHSYDNAGLQNIRLSVFFRVCPDLTFEDIVQVAPLPLLDLGNESSLCSEQAPIVLENKAINPGAILRYRWNTNDTTPQITVKKPGEYNLILYNEWGCSGTNSIVIRKDCFMDIPNAFTPNGDGVNDYFFPRQLLSKHLTSFKMQVFNQWGQLVFRTTQMNGRGWDGKFNNREQPSGVYLYTIEVLINEGSPEEYHGNVTLIR